ncbi:asparagine synthase (glutamine-hydrolyzing) [Patescibacteria group bacterium]|nr:asparagine synthase (glutamine-hydrolyzing) [Patescibacteria group bacterium]MDL1952752.1 asparagine synthase (glutamine-hydrolyzing) [Candidatus Uhrbacteria bacterium UHB]RIL01120.1 MAG: asparagine synthase (glutamine-hydrolyzing) [Candidatus Uhrbacteria bacterium]
MCGIAGMITKYGAPPDEGMLRRMTSLLAHRGPDGEGVWAAPGVGLGHRRLAIIDVSPTGAQPMHSADGRLTIVYNGELYNYKELRKVFEADGSVFRSASDTEVLLETYRRYGKDCVKHLRGMFAFAIWDAEQKQLFFARDRIGKKPFFYRTLPDGSHAFASELKALLPLAPATVDACAIRLFFGLQYVPSPRTGYENIFSLPPGYRGFADASGVRVESYNDWKDVMPPTEGATEETIRRLLEDAVRVRLQADVPVGAFLSGGIDSAAVIAFASKHASSPIRTFTMGFPEAHMDERAEARRLSEYFHTDHTEFEAKPEDLLAIGSQVIAQYDAPYADSSALPLWLLARETAKEIKVVLTGDGGDELFGGYRRYMAYAQALLLSKLPGVSTALLAAGHSVNDAGLIRMGETVFHASKNPSRAYGELFTGSYFSTNRSASLLSPAFAGATATCDPAHFVESMMKGDGKPLERAMRFDLASYLPDDLNVKMDRATMAFGLEARSPFLDQYLVGFAIGLPLKTKVNYGNTKVGLKRALRGIVPEEVLKRKKRGFQVPLAQWFRGPLAPRWKERCLDPHAKLAAYVKTDQTERLFRENAQGADHGNRLYMLYALAEWLGRN